MSAITSDVSQLDQLARQICSDWLDGNSPNTRAALQKHPELTEDLSVVLDLAYAEFCLRREAGETLDPDQFVEAFPEIRSQLLDLLGVDQTLAAHRSITRDGNDRPLLVWPDPGDEVGQCQLIRELGRGAFSRVYLAIERSAGNRPVALKLCRSAQTEANALGRLHHDHVVPILWADHDDYWQLDVVCMPYLGSVTLAEVFAGLYPNPHSLPPQHAEAIRLALESSARLDDPTPDLLLKGSDLQGKSFVEAVARFASDLAQTLAFLHARRLYHCDLKPSNLLLTSGGRLMLLDFNLSRVEGVTPRLVGGTYQYMAPEQLRLHAQGPGDVPQTAQADLFSFGVILYEWLTGKMPFGLPPDDLQKKDLPAWLLGRMDRGIVPIHRLNPHVPPTMAEIIHQCLEIDPQRRPIDASGIVRRLRPRRSPLRRAFLTAAFILMLPLGLLLGSVVSEPPRPSPEEPDSALVDRAEREAAIEELIRARRSLAQGDKENAKSDLESASMRLSRLLENSSQQGRYVTQAWKDSLNQALAAELLEDFSKAQEHLVRAEGVLRSQFISAIGLIPTSGSPLLRLLPSACSFEVAARLGHVLACRSYCDTRKARHREAILHGRLAIELGYRDARLLNNLGYSEMKLSNLSSARHHLAQALCLSPDLAPALFNSCQLAFQETLATGQEVPDYLLDDLEAALASFQDQNYRESAETYRFAAQVFARASLDLKLQAKQNAAALVEMKQREQRSREFVERACVLGLDPSPLTRDDFLREALGLDVLNPERLLAFRQHNARPVLEAYLTDPFGDPTR